MAEEELRKIVHLIPEGRFTCRHDLGFEVTVAISVDRDERSIRVNFTGTGPQLDSNFNAPPAIARSATLYDDCSRVDGLSYLRFPSAVDDPVLSAGKRT